MSEVSLYPGAIWEDEWYQSLRNATVLVLIFTQDALSSTLVQREWDYFLVAGKPIITINYVGDSLPSELKKFQYIPNNPSDEVVAQEVLSAVSKHLFAVPLTSDEIILEINDAAILTPEMLSDTIMPFIRALTELQHSINEMSGQATHPIHIREISQNSPTVIDILGIKGVVDALCEVLIPWRREARRLKNEAQKLKNEAQDLENQANRLRVQGIQEDNKTKELENEVKRLEIDRLRIENQIKALEIQSGQNKPVRLEISQGPVTNISDISSLTMIVELLKVINPDYTTDELATAITTMKQPMDQLQKSTVHFVDVRPKTLPEFKA